MVPKIRACYLFLKENPFSYCTFTYYGILIQWSTWIFCTLTSGFKGGGHTFIKLCRSYTEINNSWLQTVNVLADLLSCTAVRWHEQSFELHDFVKICTCKSFLFLCVLSVQHMYNHCYLQIPILCNFKPEVSKLFKRVGQFAIQCLKGEPWYQI